MLSVAVDVQGAAAARPWHEQAQAAFTTVVDTENVLARLHDAKVIPNGIFIAPDGTIRMKVIGGFDVARPEYPEAVRQLLQGEAALSQMPGSAQEARPLDATEQELVATKLRLGHALLALGQREQAAAEWRWALFYDPDADELVDYVEGKLDIDRKLIRSIGESMQRMEEDPIRILRAIRHKMKLGLEYDMAHEAAMREKAPLLEQTSKDRIREEFLKVCNDHSLGAFLTESRRLGLVPHIMPWFEGIPDDSWAYGMRLWDQLKGFPIPERPSADLGLSLMMVPLVNPLVLEPYKATLKESEKNYLPDMKYFLSCEPLRNFYLRR